jgi:hypothetical protein
MLKKFLLVLALACSAITCAPVEPAHAQVPFYRYHYGPINCSEAWYCPRGRWENDCYIRTHCTQNVCDAYTTKCWANKWWV